MIKKLVYSVSALLCLGASTNVNGQKIEEKSSKPNIIILLADDLGWGDVGFHGSQIKTPNIDRLSEEGVQLTRFYTAPVCSPTRAGLMTGIYPNRFGLRENVIPPWRDFGLDTSLTIIPEFLKDHGYKNRAIIGKWHLGHSRPEYYPLNNGFTHFYGHLNGAIDYFTHEREGELDWHNDYASCYDKGYSTDLIAKESVKCIKEYSKEGPFFMYVAFNAPHVPLEAKVEDLKLYGYDASKPTYSGKKGAKSLGQGNTKKQTYAAMVTCLDRGIGNILQTLKELNIEKNTLVLFMSDNGADEGSGGGSSGPLRGHKFLEYDGGVRAPAIIKWPAGFSGARTENQLTGFVDVFPTICEAVDPVEKPMESFDGISILKVLDGQQSQINRSFYLGCGALIDNNWKIIRAGKNPKMKLNNDVLYNIVNDPYEEKDMAGEALETKNKLMKEVQKFDAVKPPQKLPPFGEGRKGFVAPKEWNIFLKNK